MSTAADNDNDLLFGRLVEAAAKLEVVVAVFLASRANLPYATSNTLFGRDGFDSNLSRL